MKVFNLQKEHHTLASLKTYIFVFNLICDNDFLQVTTG